MKVATFASDMEDLKKRVYSVIFAFAFLSGLFGAILALFNNTLNATLIFILAVNTVFHPVAIYLTWRKDVPLRLVDVLTVVYGASIFSGTMMASLYLEEAGQAISIEALYLWVSVIYIFSFASFKHKTALRFSIAIWILLFAISLPFLTQSFSTYKAFLTVQMHTMTAAFMAALFFFASFQQRFRSAQLSADEMAKLANTDELTQVANRRRITELIGHELLRFSRYEHPFAIIVFDIDHFKKFNDSFGHDTGDEILRSIVNRTGDVLREVDSLGRWGGEEFIVVLPETNYAEALQKAHELCEHVASKPLLANHSITLSCGVTESLQTDSVESLFKRADEALYEAKRLGRNRAEGYFLVEDDIIFVPA